MVAIVKDNFLYTKSVSFLVKSKGGNMGATCICPLLDSL